MKSSFKTALIAAVVSGFVAAGAAVATTKTFVLGTTNTVDAASTVTAGATGLNTKMLQLTNTSTGSNATALGLTVVSGHAPFAVNSQTRVANLNADQLDGLDSSALQKRVTGTCAAGQAIRVVNANGTVSCQAVAGAGGSWSLSGNAGTTPGTNFLGTKDNKALELKVNGQRALRLEPGSTPNVVAGSSANALSSDVVGATIAGGGGPTSPDGNSVADHFGTVGGGWNNHAGNFAPPTPIDAQGATVAGGVDNVASGEQATVGGGGLNQAAESAATVGGGNDNMAGEVLSTVGGGAGNNATGTGATVPGGRFNSAEGADSFAAGHFAKARHSGAFVWADSAFANFESTAPNQFLVRASGGVGLGTNSPSNRLHVAESINANAAPANHVALIENTSTGSSGDGIAVKVGFAGNPTTSNNFLTFFRGGADSPVGAIQGNGSGGIQFVSGGADFAEWLPRLHPGETIQPGEIVGLVGGRISKATRGATQAMVVSSAPIAAGNYPGRERRAAYAPVAFLGQVPALVRGPVQAGDLIVASGRDDGTGVALPSESIGIGRLGQIVGQAWQGSSSRGLRRVRIAVGMPRELAAIQGLYRQNKVLERQNRALNFRLSRLERQVRGLSGR